MNFTIIEIMFCQRRIIACAYVSLISVYWLQNETDLHRFLIRTLTRPQYTLTYAPLRWYTSRYLFSLYVTAA